MSETISLKKHLNQRFKDIKDAIRVASAAMDKRLDGMNEFRNQLNDQTKSFVTKESVDERFTSMQSKIDALQKFNNIALGAFLIIQIMIGIALAIWTKWLSNSLDTKLLEYLW